ncbi:MAG: hypothetical protein ACRYG8_15475 [Janthinobacterium lividum]
MTEFSEFLGWTPAQWTALRMWAERKGLPRPAKPLLVTETKLGDLETMDAWFRLKVLWQSQQPNEIQPSIGDEIISFLEH